MTTPHVTLGDVAKHFENYAELLVTHGVCNGPFPLDYAAAVREARFLLEEAVAEMDIDEDVCSSCWHLRKNGHEANCMRNNLVAKIHRLLGSRNG